MSVANQKKDRITAKAGTCTPRLFVRDNVGQILQYRVRGYGKSRRTSIVRVDTPDARAERPNRKCIYQLVNEP
jgi:hypothetical protein